MVNTLALYRSPVRLVKHAHEEYNFYSPQAVSRARKKMMAEIALAGDELVIDDVSYSRNDAAVLLDCISEENWKAHAVIYAHKGLLDFLEKEEFKQEELKKADAWLYNAGFVQAISPYFAHSFNGLAGKLIRQNDFEKLTLLLDYQGYISPEHSHEAYQKIRNYLDELSYTLRNLSWEKFSADERILYFIFSAEWKRFLNKLPSSFTALRDDLVEQVTGIVLRFQHKATWYYLHQVLVQLKVIETNEFNRSEVERIDKVIYENSRIEGGKQKARGSNSEISTGRIVWWIIWIILIIVRAATCNSRSSGNYSFNEKYLRDFEKVQQRKTGGALLTEKNNEARLLHFLDSLSTSKKRTIEPLPQPIKTGDLPFSGFADLPLSPGSCSISVTNNTSYNCVMIYFDGPSRQGSIYEGSLSHTSAVYIKKGETYRFQAYPGLGNFHFLFGGKWGRLTRQAELPLSNYNAYTQNPDLFIYEYFEAGNLLNQKYLHRGVLIENPTGEKEDDNFIYLNNPAVDINNNTADLILHQKNNRFLISATGGLTVKEERKNEFAELANELKELKIKKLPSPK